MADYPASINFATTGGAAGYRLDINVSTTEVSGGTQLYVTASATRIRFDITPAFSSSGSRSYNVPGGRTNSTSGSLLESGSATWSYDFRNSNTQTVWGGFYRYIPYGPTSVTVSVTAAGSGSSFLQSTTVSVSVNLFQQVTTTQVPSIIGDYYTTAYNEIVNAGLASNITGQSTTNNASQDGIVYYQNPSAGTTVNLGSTVNWEYYIYVAPTWTVTFNRDGGGSTTTTTATDGTSVTLPSAPTKTGYTFTGWRSSYNNSVYGANTSSHAIYANTTFTAQWTAVQYTISFVENGGTNVNDITANSGTTVILPTNITRTGYAFDGWFGNSGLTDGPYASWPVSANKTFYAKWDLLAPGFTDETISQSLLLNQDFSTVADRTVSATNANNYSISYGGSNLNPTSWLTIDSVGNLSGSTNIVGTYSFIINAINIEGDSTPSNVKTITVVYPGQRFNAALGTNNITNAKRFDGSNWVSITSMKRFDGTNWVDVTS